MQILATGVVFTIGGAAWAVLRISEVGGPDEHGDYLVANATGLVIGSIIVAVGLSGTGLVGDPVRNLLELPDPTYPAPAPTLMMMCARLLCLLLVFVIAVLQAWWV